MNALPAWLIASSAAIVLLLGVIHLLYTFRGSKLLPRDAELQTHMQAVSPVISRQTSMWKAWIGFNASHSCGAILFGLVYGYLALAQSAVLFESTFLLAVGLLLLTAYAFLGKLYWFSVPYRGVLAAGALYLAAMLIRFSG